MDESPIAQLLNAVEGRDPATVTALFAADVRLLLMDGRRADGIDAARAVLAELFGELRSITSRVTEQWHHGQAWIAEIETTYELLDYLRVGPLPRAMVVRTGPDGITDVRVYGAQEHRLADRPAAEEGMWLRERWIPPL